MSVVVLKEEYLSSSTKKRISAVVTDLFGFAVFCQILHISDVY